MGLLGVVLLVCVGFGWLGAWQLGVAKDRGAEQSRRELAARPPAPLDDVLPVQQPFPTTADGRRVVVRGTYDRDQQVLVAERLQHGVPGWWVVGALRTEGGGWLPAVRGWVATPDDVRADPGAAPSGPVEVRGVLQPDDAPDDEAAPLPDGRLAALDAADLVNRWGSPIYNGFVVVGAELGSDGSPAATTGAQPERVPAPQPQPSGLAWRNAAYAVQWWVFAGFAVVLWWKMVREDQRDQAAAEREKVGV
ncbi:SURF1 family protein [Angustibacter peucedani]